MADQMVTDIRFEPCIRRKSLVGFVDFVYKRQFSFNDVGVHEKLDKSGFRLVYNSTTYPIDKKTQMIVDQTVSDFIKQKLKGENGGLSNSV